MLFNLLDVSQLLQNWTGKIKRFPKFSQIPSVIPREAAAPDSGSQSVSQMQAVLCSNNGRIEESHQQLLISLTVSLIR